MGYVHGRHYDLVGKKNMKVMQKQFNIFLSAAPPHVRKHCLIVVSVAAVVHKIILYVE